ncbi:glycosyltransferase family 39 protein [Candidatus Roizmanbacteria bacterium]|nr:glycosyltransferase family 39 protein [Candidatus Roizmanbacteria bacterium]
MSKKTVLLEVIILIVLSAFFIFYNFTAIPKFLTFDEIEFTKLALSLQDKPYIPYSLLATGHSTLYFYIILLSLKIFGVSAFALRLPAAIFGLFSVFLFYFVIRELKNYELKIKKYNVLPFLLTTILLSSRWFLNFSRFAFEPTFLLFLELTSIYFLLKYFKELKWQYLISCGLFAGLAFNSYTPGRIFFLLPLFFLTLKTLQTWKLYKLSYFIIPFLIIIAPLIIHLSTIKDTRIDQQFFLRNSEMTIDEKVDGLWHNISSTALMFFTKGDMNGRHNYPGKPALNPILAILFIFGIIVAIKNKKSFHSQLFLLYFILSLFPTLMTYPWENPNMLRTFTVILPLIYFIGLAAVSITEKLKIKYVYLFFFLIIISSLYELRTYFKYQKIVFDDSFEIKYPLEKAIKMKNPYEKVK